MFLTSLKNRFKERKNKKELLQIETEQQSRGSARKQTLSFLACPADIEPTQDGYYVKINRIWSQALVIGKSNKHNDIRKGYDEDFSDKAVDELIKISATQNAAILYTHIMIPIDPLTEAMMLGQSIKKVALSEEQTRQGQQATLNSEYNQLNKRELREHTTTVFHGKDHYYQYGLCAAVFGKSREDVDEIIDLISAKLDECGIRYEVPRYNQLGIIKSMLPTNYVNPKILQPVAGRVVSKMLPLRAMNPSYPEDGIILGIDDTGKPVKATFTKKDAGHILCLGKTGSGKTVFELMIAGRALAHGARVIILEPKNEDEDGTDYKNFCSAYGGKLIRIGPLGQNFNPLQVFYDPKVMGTDQASYQKALSDHYETLRAFFSMWIGPTFKNRMKGFLSKTLIELYQKKGLIDSKGMVQNTEQWTNGLMWPTIGDLRHYWQELLDKKFDPSIEALMNNTIDAMIGGPLNWIDNHDSPELDNDLIILDISNVSLNIQNAFSVLMMGIINTRFFPKPVDGTPRRRTFVFFDEGVKLLKINELRPFNEKMFRESRSSWITTGFFSQDTEDIGESTLNMMKNNCSNIFLLCNMKQSSIGAFEKVFDLREEHKGRLLEEGHGIALYLREPYAVNMDIVLTKHEENALLSGEKTEQKVSSRSCFEVDEEVKWIYEQHGFFIQSWVSRLEDINVPGWTFYPVQDAFSPGQVNAWIRNDLINDDGKILNQGYKHYSTVCMIAGKICQLGFTDVQINHRNDVDISFKIGDVAGCIEVEMPGTHSQADWKAKKQKAETTYQEIIFTCPTEIEQDIIKALGKGFVFRRGTKLLRQLEKIKADQLSNLQQVTPQTEA
jgi:hypothetical protein